MALQYVGGCTGGGTGASYTVSLSGTLTGGLASSPSQGDLILVFTGECNAATMTTTCSGNTSGAYSTITAHINRADTLDANLDSFYQFAGSTPDTTLTITRGNNNTTNGCATAVHVWRNVDSGTPFDGVTVTTASSANSSVADPPAITPSTAGAVIVYVGQAPQNGTGTSFTTAGGSYLVSARHSGSTASSDVAIEAYTSWTSGSYNPSTFGGSTTATSLAWAALSLVLRPTIHDGSGALAGGSATVVGSASRSTPAVNHATTGALAAGSATVVGTASNFTPHSTTGILSAGSATVAGTASRTGGSVTHATTGDLSAGSAAVVGTASNFTPHSTTGALSAGNATVDGTASNFTPHSTTGAISAGTASVVGAASNFTPHATTGALSAGTATVVGAGTSAGPHVTTGALSSGNATVSGTAVRHALHTSTGVLSGGSAIIVGTSARTGSAPNHATTGALSGGSAIVAGVAASPINLSLTADAIQALAAAVWAQQLPLSAAPVVSYGATSLTQNDLDAIARQVWSQALPGDCP